MAPEGTVPWSFTVTDCPAGSEESVQVSVLEVKVTPFGSPGLEMLVMPWAGSVSTTETFEASEGPVLETTTV